MATFREAIQPLRVDLIVGSESTFNGYWLADFLREQRNLFILGHTLFMRAIHAG